MSNRLNSLLLSAAITGLMSGAALAQSAANDDEIIVTGVAKATTAFDSSASVTALSAADVTNLAPRSVSELFRALPGVKSENTGGDANANIKVRGLPIASGGSRYFSIQENGFPTLLVGDTSFATADSFVRVDNTIGSVQSIRGGSSATQAPNAAGGIVNLISKKPTEAGGSVAGTFGLDYDSYRIDAEYGGVFGGGGYYHVGGFARTGEGVRQVEGSQEEGYQIKATIGQSFERGSFAVHLKHLDDRVPTYLPMPMRVQGDDLDSIGLDLGNGSNSLGLTDYAVRADGSITEDKEGFTAKMSSIGFEGDYAVSDTIDIGASARYADISGSFYSPFPFNVSESGVAGVELVEFALFNTRTPNMNNVFSDVFVQGEFDAVTVKAGLAYANQNSEHEWNFNEARAVLVGDTLVTEGLPGTFTNPADGSFIDGFAAGNPAFGFCCTRYYDFEIENFAPYISANIDLDRLSLDVSYRRNENTVTGQFTETSTVAPLDINGDGTIATNEQNAQTVDLSTLRQVDYDANFDAFSVGANYQVNGRIALFANYSEGASLTSPDRSTGTFAGQTGVLTAPGDAFLNFVDAFELGAKFRLAKGDFSIVYFNADVREAGQFEVTTQTTIQNSFDTSGIEAEASFDLSNGFGVNANATYTDSEISGPANNANLGNTPRRQSDLIFNLNPYYEADRYDLGLNIFGTTDSFAQDSNQFKLPGYTLVGAYVNFDVRDNLSLSVAANNLLDANGFTEAEGDGFASGDLVRFRPINGRTVSATVRYDF